MIDFLERIWLIQPIFNPFAVLMQKIFCRFPKL